MTLGGIQQLRGQEEGEGGSTKSPRLSTQGGGGVLECPRGQNRSYLTVMGGKKGIKSH